MLIQRQKPQVLSDDALPFKLDGFRKVSALISAFLVHPMLKNTDPSPVIRFSKEWQKSEPKPCWV